jgi:hypothetical protein
METTPAWSDEILSASQSRTPGTIHILIVTEHVESFFQFLKQKGVSCSLPSEAVHQGAQMRMDKYGRWHLEQACVVHTFDAEASPEAFRKLTDDWCLAFLGRKPMPRSA